MSFGVALMSFGSFSLISRHPAAAEARGPRWWHHSARPRWRRPEDPSAPWSCPGTGRTARSGCLHGHQMRALLLVEVVEVRLVLEVVGVNLAILGGGVRLHVVGEFLDDQLVAVLLDERFDRLVQDLRVRGRGRRATVMGLVVLLGGGTVGTGIAAAARPKVASVVTASSAPRIFLLRMVEFLSLNFATRPGRLLRLRAND